MKKLLILIGTGLLLHSSMQAQQVFSLSTGVAGNGPNLIPLGNNDDTWVVRRPDGTLAIPRTCNLNAWAENTCSRWISPNVVNEQASGTLAGDYEYFMSFSTSTCPVQSAVITFSSIGADNNLNGLEINGFMYTLSPPSVNDYNPLSTNISITINPAHIIAGGANNITLFVNNTTNGFTGLNVCGDITINRPDLELGITASPVLCNGSLLSVTGTDGPGSALFHAWILTETDMFGTPVPGGYTYSSAPIGGSPGSFTFPGSNTLPCNKYYRITLRAISLCTNGAEVSRIVYADCGPAANAGPDKTICEGECTLLGTPYVLGMGYLWSPGGQFTAQPEVCPQQTTTYTLYVINRAGCSNTDQVTVTVRPNNPAFDIATTSLPGYFTISAAPVVTNAHLTQPGFGHYWALQELDNADNVIFSFDNPSSWWPYPGANVFKGFNHPANPGYSGTYTSIGTSPDPGRFLYNRRYRIIRGTWNSNCEWRQTSVIITSEKSLLAGGTPSLQIREESNAPDFSYLAAGSSPYRNELSAENDIRIFPNPGTGIFNLTLPGISKGYIEILDMSGKRVYESSLPGHSTTFRIDLSSYQKGMYLLNLKHANGSWSEKIILQ